MAESFLSQLLEGRISQEELGLLPRRWRIIGDAIIVKKKEGVSSWGLIGESLLLRYPRCKYVLLDHGIYGLFREPERELIASRETPVSFETLHRENGCIFKLDLLKLMFSQGNLQEKQRLKDKCQGEVVVDMFAGIGYFTVPIAVHSRPEKILAIELNPVSYRYLGENIKLNKIGHLVEAIHGDCGNATPAGIADRVIMGHLSSEKYLPVGIKALKTGGILHYHEAVPEALYPKRPVERVKRAALETGYDIKSVKCRRVKKYSPGVIHSVTDVIVT